MAAGGTYSIKYPNREHQRNDERRHDRPLTDSCVSELRIDDVHKTIQMKDKHGESSPCGSPFIQEIQDTPILQHFHLPALEAYDSGSDPMEHVTAFMAHMALYGMSNAIMCWVFSTTLCGVARGWYRRLSPAFICSFDQLAREGQLPH
ncbi:hypothetical protein BHE74_00020419 [Ensete ventricosum]|nr:hypothetical protein BHE74_00020419 [Ensete ventricosum]